MAQKTTAFIMLILVLGVGFVAGSFLGGFLTKFTAPSTHRSIIESMTVTDTKANIQLTPKLLSSSKVECGKGLSVYFIKGKQYQQTVWTWERYGDVELVMVIWGPDETGKTYGVEVARIAWDPFEVKINGVTKLKISEVTSTEPAIGYYQLTVTLEQ
ncbi:MAG: hypothetical protein ACPLZY_03930 [Candidatus Norongarragalinales archaeon]